eukprot:403352633
MYQNINESPTTSNYDIKHTPKTGGNPEQETLVSIDILLEMEKQEKESFENQVKSNAYQSYFNSVKIFLGNVFLTMPNVFTQTGWLGGFILYTMIAIMNTYTMNQILWVGAVYSKRKNAHGQTQTITSYTDLATRIHGVWGKVVVIISLYIVQLSCCIGYLYFIAQNLDNIICDQTNQQYCDRKTMYKFLLMIPTIPICLIKTYTYLSYVSMTGIFCAFLGGIIMIGICGSELNNGTYVHEPVRVFDVENFFGYIGIAMFIFEGNGIVLNLNHEAKDKKKYPKILTSAVITVITWYMIMTFVCYFTYRGLSMEYITSNLKINGLTIFVYILFSYNAIASYPVQILCAFEIIEELKFFKQESDSNLIRNVKVYSERILVIVVVTIVAVIVPRFVDFLNITGALGSSILGFILPPLYYFKCYGLKNLTYVQIGWNLFLIIFGTLGALYSIYQSSYKLAHGQ